MCRAVTRSIIRSVTILGVIDVQGYTVLTTTSKVSKIEQYLNPPRRNKIVYVNLLAPKIRVYDTADGSILPCIL